MFGGVSRTGGSRPHVGARGRHLWFSNLLFSRGSSLSVVVWGVGGITTLRPDHLLLGLPRARGPGDSESINCLDSPTALALRPEGHVPWGPREWSFVASPAKCAVGMACHSPVMPVSSYTRLQARWWAPGAGALTLFLGLQGLPGDVAPGSSSTHWKSS